MSMIEEIEKELHALEVGVASEVRGVRVVRTGGGVWVLYPLGSDSARGGRSRWAAALITVATGGDEDYLAPVDREWAATLLPPRPEGREADVEAVAKGDGREFNWRSAMRALSSEPLPPRLRTALVELGVHGHRLHVAVGAYGARTVRMMADPEERELPVRSCRDWPEHAERAEALRSYEEAREAVAAMARAWVDGLAVPEDYGTGVGVPLRLAATIRNRLHSDAEYDPDPAASASYPGSDPGKWTTVETPRPAQPKSDGTDLALSIADELADRFPGPCSAIRDVVKTSRSPLSRPFTKEEAVAVVRSYLSSISLRQLSPALAERFRVASLTSPKPEESPS